MFDTSGMMACNCREDNSSPSLCAKLLVLLGPGPHQGGGHCGVYTPNRCHGVIVCCCKNMAQDKMGVINQREIQRKPRHLPSKWQTLMLSQFPAGMTYFSYNVEINLGLPALLLFIRQIEAKRKKKTNPSPTVCFHYFDESQTHWLQRLEFLPKNASARSLKFEPTFPNVGARDRTAGFIILTSQETQFQKLFLFTFLSAQLALTEILMTLCSQLTSLSLSSVKKGKESRTG